MDHTPVLILGGVPEEKTVLLTDTNFKDYVLVEVRVPGEAWDYGQTPQDMLPGKAETGKLRLDWFCTILPSWAQTACL